MNLLREFLASPVEFLAHGFTAVLPTAPLEFRHQVFASLEHCTNDPRKNVFLLKTLKATSAPKESELLLQALRRNVPSQLDLEDVSKAVSELPPEIQSQLRNP